MWMCQRRLRRPSFVRGLGRSGRYDGSLPQGQDVRVRINLVDADPDGDRHATAGTKRSVSVTQCLDVGRHGACLAPGMSAAAGGSDCVKQFRRGDCVAVRQGRSRS
jgi:hypothetical protein